MGEPSFYNDEDFGLDLTRSIARSLYLDQVGSTEGLMVFKDGKPLSYMDIIEVFGLDKDVVDLIIQKRMEINMIHGEVSCLRQHVLKQKS